MLKHLQVPVQLLSSKRWQTDLFAAEAELIAALLEEIIDRELAGAVLGLRRTILVLLWESPLSGIGERIVQGAIGNSRRDVIPHSAHFIEYPAHFLGCRELRVTRVLGVINMSAHTRQRRHISQKRWNLPLRLAL